MADLHSVEPCTSRFWKGIHTKSHIPPLQNGKLSKQAEPALQNSNFSTSYIKDYSARVILSPAFPLPVVGTTFSTKCQVFYKMQTGVSKPPSMGMATFVYRMTNMQISIFLVCKSFPSTTYQTWKCRTSVLLTMPYSSGQPVLFCSENMQEESGGLYSLKHRTRFLESRKIMKACCQRMPKDS